MKKIIYFASNSSMGDTQELDCEKYRSWALNRLESEYPDYDIEVENKESFVSAWTNDEENKEKIIDFCHRLWDNCPWDWD